MAEMGVGWSDGPFHKHLKILKEQGLYRCLRTVQSEQGPWVELEGRRVLNLCSNNYLGLASHPRLKEAAAQAALTYGCGTGASRLISGNMVLHQILERRLAAFKQQEATLLYNSGYTANLGIIPSLVGKGDFIFSDELNHASIIDGCRLSRAQIIIFPHNDIEALEEKLRLACTTKPKGRRLIVVDALFSMDGDLAPLPELVGLAEKYGALLMVDEAHATGTLGPRGRGAIAHFGLEGRIPIIMGTLGKALGSFGAFVAGSRGLIDYLTNTSRSFIFTTALPPTVIASSLAALDLLETTPSLVTRLQHNTSYLREGLRRLGYNLLGSPKVKGPQGGPPPGPQTPIIPLIIGEALTTYEMSRLLLKEGILATAIRPPTVPEGTSRIRVTVMATHTLEDLDLALEAFERVGRHLAII